MTPRPDPDALLRQVQEAEALAARAKLKIFFGAAPGVGKTYAMLSEAKERQAIGIDVVVGVVETHGRSETALQAEGFERIPPRELPYHGKFYPEFDLDAALRRRPQLILMDELAHTNMQGSRHAKRWQDVMELLDAGIDVYTTINVQHMESLRDVVAQITGIVVREGVPDTVLERADEVELVDLPPEDLIQRLREGKVYVPDQARHAIDRFFRKGNLLALRELALRQTAQSVDAQMRRYMASEGIQKTWAAGERVLVCVGPSALTARLIRGARRLSASLGAPWIALYVETTRHLRYSEEDQARVEANLRLAEQLGGETAVVQGGARIGEDILAFARSRNVTKIVVGKPTRPRWTELLRGSLLEELVRGSGDIDVYVITGDPETEAARPALARRPAGPRPQAYLGAAAAVALATAAAHLFHPAELADIVMVYLLAIVVVAARLGRWPSLLASALSVGAFDWFFIPPYQTFTVTDLRHLGTFGVMFLVGLVISNLTERIRQQARLARAREQKTQALYRLSGELARAAGSSELVASAIHSVAEQFQGRTSVLLPDAEGRLAPSGEAGFPLTDQERAVAQWVLEHGEPAGLGTGTLPGAGATYLPLKGASGTLGVMGLLPEGAPRWADPDSLRLLEAFANQTALAIERALLSERAAEAHRRADEERLRNALLSSVSHDLRTPLGGILGAATTLLADPGLGPTPKDLAQTIQEEAQRLHRLVTNLLDITRLESGALSLAKEWVPLEELVGSALSRLEPLAAGRDVRVDLPEGLPMVQVDPVLFEQALVNLLENALRHGGDPIEVKAWSTGPAVTFSVGDRGPGLPEGLEDRLFDKLVRGPGAKGPGAGLGLAICKGIVEAHGGTIRASNRHHVGGAQFYVTLPVGPAPPAPPQEDTPMEG
ncbi:MAG TPA: sensor histidine kinase KdpD [Holophagaceae bacterium]|nr:sensor histidine kinase KdpD [Holophagaceae bacterium]